MRGTDSHVLAPVKRQRRCQQLRADISIIIPSKDREEDVNRCVHSIVTQETQPREIVVVDQSARRYSLPVHRSLIHMYEPHLSGLTAARNVGIRRATSDIIFFLDDDCELMTDCVRLLAEGFGEHPEAIAIACNLLHPPEWQRLSLHKLGSYVFEVGFFNLRPKRTREGVFLRNATGVAAFRSWLFQHELFDEKLTGPCTGEDWEFSLRAARYGYIIKLEQARVRHNASRVNRADVRRHLQNRWANSLYVYQKLAADTPWNRLCKVWWMLGESLKWFRAGIGLPFF
jgi:glycosyltransferase involved in cell wall biosynthesis